MRLPGTGKVSKKLVKAFDITDVDRRIIKRGGKDLYSTTVGAGVAYVSSGGDLVADPKAAVVFVVTSAATAMAQKHRSEKVTQALYQPPPNGTK